MWRDFPEKLAQKTGCGAMVYSRLGYGDSDACELPRSLNFMHPEGLEVLPEIIVQCKINKCILVGHSDGASIALIYAGENSTESLLGIVTEAPHVFCEQLTIRSIEKVGEQFRSGISGNFSKNIMEVISTVLSKAGWTSGFIPILQNGTSNRVYRKLWFRN